MADIVTNFSLSCQLAPDRGRTTAAPAQGCDGKDEGLASPPLFSKKTSSGHVKRGGMRFVLDVGYATLQNGSRLIE
jgi:hypothetical protein